MEPEVIRNAPLNVLVVLADADTDVAQILPALEPNYTLVCPSPRQGLEAAGQFDPDIVFVDLKVPDASTLVRNLEQASGGRNLVFVAMTRTDVPTSAVPTGFHYGLPVSATSGEVEQLLWRIGRDLTGRGPRPRPLGSEKIG